MECHIEESTLETIVSVGNSASMPLQLEQNGAMSLLFQCDFILA
jgi:hypothetical protein